MRWELEDLAFKYLEPTEYKTLAKKVAQKRGEREELDRADCASRSSAQLAKAGIANVEVTGRPKHLWSIYKKMKKRDKPYEEIYDLLAIRVLVNIGSRLLPRARRHPRPVDAAPGAHQGLHRAAEVERIPVAAHDGVRPGRQLYEIQIRTREMHRTAEFGIAAHWRTRRTRRAPTSSTARCTGSGRCSSCSWTRRRPTSSSSSSSSTCIRTRSSSSRRRATSSSSRRARRRSTSRSRCTPRSGCTAQGAKVNGRIAPLVARAARTPRRSRSSRRRRAKPSRDWLAHVRTGRARHKIRQCAPHEEQRHGGQARPGDSRPRDQAPSAREAGRRRAAEGGARRSTSPTSTHLHGVDRAGRRQRRAGAEGSSIPDADAAPEPPKPGPLERLVDRVRGTPKGVRIQGVDGLMVRYAQCCQPVPGDRSSATSRAGAA